MTRSLEFSLMTRQSPNLGAEMVTYTILGVAYDNYSILGPKTLFQLLMPLYYPFFSALPALSRKAPEFVPQAQPQERTCS